MSPTLPAVAPEAGPCAQRAAVDRHFARRLSLPQERTLRAHLSGCATCHRHYQRRLALERLQPGHEAAAQARLATALGLQRRALPAGSVAAAVTLTALLTLGVLADWRAQQERPASLEGAFAARGSALQDPGVLRAYRIRAGHPPAPLEGELAAADELAFGYLNPASRPWLLVYGADEHGHVYWFHPRWDEPAADPAALPARSGPALHELPEAISHALDGQRLTVHGVLSEQRLTVRQVEALRQGLARDAPLPLQDAEQTALDVKVTP